MEQDYVTAAFFRHAIAQRQQHIQQLEDMQQIMEGAGLHMHNPSLLGVGDACWCRPECHGHLPHAAASPATRYS